MKRNQTKREIELEKTLKEIAFLGHGIKEEVRDWAAIGRNAVMTARNSIAGKCESCGKPKDFK